MNYGKTERFGILLKLRVFVNPFGEGTTKGFQDLTWGPDGRDRRTHSVRSGWNGVSTLNSFRRDQAYGARKDSFKHPDARR